MKILSVGIGGILGTLARYFIYIPLNANTVFPWGTFTVNLAGSFFLAFFLTYSLRRFSQGSMLVLAVSTGFTGSFTTFSAVSVEAVKLAYINPPLLALYIMSSFIGGLLLAFAGRHLGNSFSRLLEKRLGRRRGREID